MKYCGQNNKSGGMNCCFTQGTLVNFRSSDYETRVCACVCVCGLLRFFGVESVAKEPIYF